ncbi:hypothetical protein KA005_19740, partial [bacterium]|nr:hypothetical protein [bacterium]
SSNLESDMAQLGTQIFDIPIAQWSDTVDLTIIPKAVQFNVAGTYYVMAIGSSTIEPIVISVPTILPVAIKRIGASTAVGLDGDIKGIL